MKTKMFSAMLAALTLATASIGGITASAEEIAASEDETAETTAVDEEESTEETTVTTTKSETAPNVTSDISDVTTKTLPDFYGDPYYDTGGNASLIKSETIICNTEEMQFIAVTTKDGHVFYVLINYSAENSEDQVFFLNKVDDYDLYALLYAGEEDEDGNAKFTPQEAAEAAEKANGRVQSNDNGTSADAENTSEDGGETNDTETQTTPAPMNKNSIYLVVGAVALIGVGAAAFMLTKKKSKGKSAVTVEPDEEETEIFEGEDEDDIKFYDNNDDE